MSAVKQEARLYRVRGRVQGVGYRYFVQQSATRLELTGWTMNLDDGRVEVYAQGPLERLTEFEGLLWKGPRWAEVRGVDVTTATPQKLRDFQIRS
ncbi:MAG TPA: acylphosphatase [Bryobacteraceae bacterium]